MQFIYTANTYSEWHHICLLQVLLVNSSALEVYTVIKRHQHTERVTQLSFIWELQAHFLGGLSDHRPTPSVGSNFKNRSSSQDLTNLFVLLLCNQKHNGQYRWTFSVLSIKLWYKIFQALIFHSFLEYIVISSWEYPFPGFIGFICKTIQFSCPFMIQRYLH